MKRIPREVLEVAGLLWWQFSQISTGRVMRAINGPPMVNGDDFEIANRAEELGYLYRKAGTRGDWVWTFSEDMQKRMVGELNPLEYWSSGWTRQWTLVTFDIPRNNTKARNQLHYLLKKLRFGCLQGSVWISPRPISDISGSLTGIDVKSSEICIFTAKQMGKDRDLARLAWNWERIGDSYEDYKGKLDHMLSLFDEGKISLKELVAEDSVAWTKTTQQDPFLPEPLWPQGYSGFNLWKYRSQKIRRRLKTKPSSR